MKYCEAKDIEGIVEATFSNWNREAKENFTSHDYCRGYLDGAVRMYHIRGYTAEAIDLVELRLALSEKLKDKLERF